MDKLICSDTSVHSRVLSTWIWPLEREQYDCGPDSDLRVINFAMVLWNWDQNWFLRNYLLIFSFNTTPRSSCLMNKHIIFSKAFLPLSDTFLLTISKFFMHTVHILQMGKPAHGPCLSSQSNSLAGLQACHAGGPESMPVVLAAKPHFIPRRLYLRLIHFLRARFCPFPQSSVLHCSASRHTVPGHQLLEAAIFSGDIPSHLSI